MILKLKRNITSDDENSQQTIMSDCDSEFDSSPTLDCSSKNHSTVLLDELSINQYEPPMTRSRSKTIEKTMIISQSTSKEQHRSTIRRSIDSSNRMNSTLTDTILFPKQESSNNQCPTTPTDGVNTLTDWFRSCSLDESKLSKNCFWANQKKTGHYSSLPNGLFGSNLSSVSQALPRFVESSSTTTLFDRQQSQLWSRFRFSDSTIRNYFWIEQPDSTPSNIFTSKTINQYSDQTPILSSSCQVVPTSLSKTPPILSEESTFTQSKQSQIKSEDKNVKKLSSKMHFSFIIFVVGLVLGYFLTTTLPPSFICHWLFIIWKIFAEISVKYFYLFYAVLQIITKHFLSFILA